MVNTTVAHNKLDIRYWFRGSVKWVAHLRHWFSLLWKSTNGLGGFFTRYIRFLCCKIVSSKILEQCYGNGTLTGVSRRVVWLHDYSWTGWSRALILVFLSNITLEHVCAKWVMENSTDATSGAVVRYARRLGLLQDISGCLQEWMRKVTNWLLSFGKLYPSRKQVIIYCI